MRSNKQSAGRGLADVRLVLPRVSVGEGLRGGVLVL